MTSLKPALRCSSTGRPGVSVPIRISPLASSGILGSSAFARSWPISTLELPISSLTASSVPLGGGTSTATSGMFCDPAVCSGRMNRSGVSVIIATPSFDVRVAAWKSCTCLGPLTSAGAASVRFTPGVSSAAAFAPSAISCAKLVVVVG